MQQGSPPAETFAHEIKLQLKVLIEHRRNNNQPKHEQYLIETNLIDERINEFQSKK